MTEGDLLTPDEQLIRKPRWQGETWDLKTKLRNMLKEHLSPHFLTYENVDESEDVLELVEAQTILISQLAEAAYQRGLSEGE